MKKILFLILFMYIMALSLNAYTYSVFDGGKDTFYKNLNLTKKMEGRYALELPKNRGYFDSLTDISLDFDSQYSDRAILKISPNIKYTQGIVGSKAIFMPNANSNIEVDVSGSAMFRSDNAASFTIEFYLKPSINLINADIIKHVGMYTEKGVYNHSVIKATIINGRVVWQFKDFFRYGDNTIDIILSEGTYIKVNEWSHHSISFDAKSGRLVKYLNGVEEEVVYVTTTGDKNGGVYTRHVSDKNVSPLVIGAGFVGTIDGFNITSGYKRNYDLGVYNQTGEAISEVINLKSDIAYLQSISVNGSVIEDSDIRLYYRASDLYFSADDNAIPWVYIKSGYDLGYTKQQYVQVKVVLVSDYKKRISPFVNSVNIEYDIPKIPHAPFELKAKPLNSAVMLTWKESHNGDAIGYKVYYSTIKGVYNEYKEVPIIIGKESSYLVSGLENDRVYYFKVSAFGTYGEMQESEFSSEVYAIPKSILP